MIRCPACGALNRPESHSCVVCGVGLGREVADSGQPTLMSVPTPVRARLESAIAEGVSRAEASQALSGATAYGLPRPDFGPNDPFNAEQERSHTSDGWHPSQAVPSSVKTAPEPSLDGDPMRRTLYGQAPSGWPSEISMTPTPAPVAPAPPPVVGALATPKPARSTGPAVDDPMRRTMFGRAAVPENVQIYDGGQTPPPGAMPPPVLVGGDDPRSTLYGRAPAALDELPTPDAARRAMYGQPPRTPRGGDPRRTSFGMPQALRTGSVVPVPIPKMPEVPMALAPTAQAGSITADEAFFPPPAGVTPVPSLAPFVPPPTEPQPAAQAAKHAPPRVTGPHPTGPQPTGPRPSGPHGPMRGTLDAEAVAALRIQAASQAEERRAAKRRLRVASVLLILVVVGAGIAAGLLLRQRSAFRAELEGDLIVTHRAGDYTIEVGVRTSEPSVVVHPAGSQPVTDVGRVAFSLPSEEMHVGDNTVGLTVRANESGEEQLLTLHVLVYYRLRTEIIPPPRPGIPIKAHVELMPDWSLTVEGGVSARIANNTYEVQIDPGPLLARVDTMEGDTVALPVPLVLRDPDGKEQTFTEVLQVPIPATPITVLRPPHGWISDADKVRVGGRTVPGAEVTVAGQLVKIDAGGYFDVQVPLGAPGRHTIEIVANGPKKRAGRKSISLERLSEAAFTAARGGLRSEAAAYEVDSKAPTYKSLVDDPEPHRGQKIRLRGELLDARRGREGNIDTLQLATCKVKSRCPYWVELSGPMMAGPGDMVEVVGTLHGNSTYKTHSGVALTVPRLKAEFLVP